jgi:hypothetical protein
MMTKTQKNPAYWWLIAIIGRNTCPMVVTSDFNQSPGPPLLGNACDIVPAHQRSCQNG